MTPRARPSVKLPEQITTFADAMVGYAPDIMAALVERPWGRLDQWYAPGRRGVVPKCGCFVGELTLTIRDKRQCATAVAVTEEMDASNVFLTMAMECGFPAEFAEVAKDESLAFHAGCAAGDLFTEVFDDYCRANDAYYDNNSELASEINEHVVDVIKGYIRHKLSERESGSVVAAV